MFKFKQFVHRLGGDNDNGRDGTGDSSAPAFSVEPEDQHSAEGFLCPSCMRAFPSGEALEEHYKKTHTTESDASSDVPEDEIESLRREVFNLQTVLSEERTVTEELKNEIFRMQADCNSKEQVNVVIRSQGKDLQDAKSLLSSEITLLRQQYTDSLEQISQLKKEKEILSQKILTIASESDHMKINITSLETQLNHRNSVDDTAVLRQELVSVQKMMNSMALEKEENIEVLNVRIQELEGLLKQKESEAEANKNLKNEACEMEQEFEKKYMELQETGVRDRSELETMRSKLTSQLENMEFELGNTRARNETLEEDLNQRREEIKRLEQQHSELYSKIKGGEEGTKAALDALQKENELIKQNLEASQIQNANLSKDSHNLKTEVDKLRQLYQKLTAETSAASEASKAVIQSLKDQMKVKDGEVQNSNKKNEDLAQKLTSKDNDIEAFKVELEKTSSTLVKLQKDLESARTSEAELFKKLGENETFIKTLSASIESKNGELDKVTSSRDALSEKLQNETLQLAAVVKDFQSLQEECTSLKSDLSNLEGEYERAKDAAAKSQLKLNNDLEIALNQNDLLGLQKEEIEKNATEVQAELHKKVELLDKAGNAKKLEIEALQRSVSEITLKLEKAEGTEKVLLLQMDEILAEKIDMERKLKNIEEEKSLLLERCLSGEAEGDRLQEKIGEVQRRLDDSLAALQELGRENQSLQMESAKLQGRKWADDSVVNTCTTCIKEFTLTVRKHHCRHCGQIFCAECSSRTASVPSSKKPVRVCDACFQELSVK